MATNDNLPQQIKDGDDWFLGFASRLDPGNLPEKMLQASQNMRLQRGTATIRKGVQRLTGVLNGGVNDEFGYNAVGTYTNPATGEDYIAIAGRFSLVLCNQNGTVWQQIPYAWGSWTNNLFQLQFLINTDTPNVGSQILQANDKLYIFRGQLDQAPRALKFSNPSIANGATGLITLSGGPVPTTREIIFQSVSHPELNGAYARYNGSFYWTNNTGSNFPSHSLQNCVVSGGLVPLVWQQGQATVLPVNQLMTTGTTANLPCSDFGFYFQNRIVCKTGDYTLAVSDILEETFDVTLNNFNINNGSGDKIVGVLPWIQNQFLVFMDKSIYVCYLEPTLYVTGTPPGANSSMTIVTTEVGCLARRTIVSAGQFVFFLSPKGVHMLTPQLDLKLLGNTLPLSEPISDIFDNLNYQYAYKACAAYYSNRFYLSIPYEGSEENNRVVVYNTLNQQWESLDKYDPYLNYAQMYVDEFFVQTYQSQRRLFVGARMWLSLLTLSQQSLCSGVGLLEEVNNFDNFSYIPNSQTIVPSPINGLMKTREYMFDSLGEKRFTRAQVQTSNIAGDRVQITASAYDPDAQEMILDYTFEGGTHTTLRPRVALRGSAIDIEVQILSGSPSVKTVSVTGITTDRQMISQE